MNTFRLMAAALAVNVSVCGAATAQGIIPNGAVTVTHTRETVQMAPDTVQVLLLDENFANIFVGSTEVVELAIISDRRIGITSKSAGTTNIVFLDEIGDVLKELRVEVKPEVQLNRREVTVTQFGQGGRQATMYRCELDGFRGCFFDTVRPAIPPSPTIIQTGPMFVNGTTVQNQVTTNPPAAPSTPPPQ